jgi:DNA-directed RNA polymerase subunit RPC12/RpoP
MALASDALVKPADGSATLLGVVPGVPQLIVSADVMVPALSGPAVVDPKQRASPRRALSESDFVGVGGGRQVYRCPTCQKEFSRKTNLTRHSRIHTSEKRFMCPTCKREFLEKHHLQGHLRIHSGERPYRCPECERAFAQRSNMLRHFRIHQQKKYVRPRRTIQSHPQPPQQPPGMVAASTSAVGGGVSDALGHASHTLEAAGASAGRGEGDVPFSKPEDLAEHEDEEDDRADVGVRASGERDGHGREAVSHHGLCRHAHADDALHEDEEEPGPEHDHDARQHARAHGMVGEDDDDEEGAVGGAADDGEGRGGVLGGGVQPLWLKHGHSQPGLDDAAQHVQPHSQPSRHHPQGLVHSHPHQPPQPPPQQLSGMAAAASAAHMRADLTPLLPPGLIVKSAGKAPQLALAPQLEAVVNPEGSALLSRLQHMSHLEVQTDNMLELQTEAAHHRGDEARSETSSADADRQRLRGAPDHDS